MTDVLWETPELSPVIFWQNFLLKTDWDTRQFWHYVVYAVRIGEHRRIPPGDYYTCPVMANELVVHVDVHGVLRRHILSKAFLSLRSKAI